MSDARAKAERSKAKDMRQGVIEQKPIIPKAKVKVDKPFIVCKWWKWRIFGGFEKPAEKWEVKKFETLELAKQYRDREMRVYNHEYWIEQDGVKIND
jgi:hypothetical protein